MPDGPTVAIVGGGCSGTLAAIHLMRHPASDGTGRRIVMIEPTADIGRGLAYRTTRDCHLLNVPAGDMSAFPDDPFHFVSWLRLRHADLDAGSFVPRRLYGDYLRSVLAEATSPRTAPNGHSFDVLVGRAVALDARGDGRVALTCSDTRVLAADVVVLALGTFPPPHPPAVVALATADPGSGYIGDPWGTNALDGISPDDSVLLLGSGLTAVDTVLALRARGHRGPIGTLSRHGLLPQAQPTTCTRPLSPDPTILQSHSAREILHLLRQRVDAEGGDWRPVIDGLRGDSNRIWAQLPPAEQRRVRRHLQTHWNVHRHRMAPQAAAGIAQARADGQLLVRAGTLVRCTARDGAIRATIRDRGISATTDTDVDHLINCTGPATDVTALHDPLVDSMVARGRAAPGPLGVGLAVSADGAVLNRHGQPDDRLWAIGSLRQGTTWETTAVPEIRRQAAALAVRLGAPAGSRSPSISNRTISDRGDAWRAAV